MEYIPAVMNAMFWMGVGITLRTARDWLRSQMRDDELLFSYKTMQDALDPTKDGKNGKNGK